jgi:hypothetical protein
MSREEIKNKIFEYLKKQINLAKANPNQNYQLQLGGFFDLFSIQEGETQLENKKTLTIAREVVQELENSGLICEGNGFHGNSATYPWYTITEYGKKAILEDNWLPYDPDGYVNTLKAKIPSIDDITIAYISEAISAYNYRHLLSATLTLGVASENLMLMLIESYSDWIPDKKRRASFAKKQKGDLFQFNIRNLKRNLRMM